MAFRIVHVALGGCLSAPPVPYGLTEDTGGHIGYVLGAASGQARRSDVASVEIVTRRFDSPATGCRFAVPVENVAPGCRIVRLASDRSGYLEKDALARELPALRRAFLDHLATGPLPHVIHAHFADACELARAARDRFGIPVVYTPHSLGGDKRGCAEVAAVPSRRLARERAAIRNADAILASSRDESERQIAACDRVAAGRTWRINPGVTPPRAADPRRARAFLAPHLADPGKPVLLAVARPVRKKNLAGLLEAFAAAPDLVARANLVILAGQRDSLVSLGGEAGAVLGDLSGRIARHGLAGRVALPDRHGPRDVADLYALAAEGGVFVNPALHEPFGLTIVEAAQAGVPVVATDRGGPADILRDIGAGSLVSPDDPAAIAAACRAALDDPAIRETARGARNRARALFDWDRWAAASLGLYRALAAPPRTARRPAPRRLLASDLDATLTGSRKGAAAFAAWRAAHPDCLFALVTGRPVQEARRVLRDWGLPEPDIYATSVGTEIWRPGRGAALTPDEGYAARLDIGWAPEAAAEIAAGIGLAPQAACEQRPWKRSFLGSGEQAGRLGAALAGRGVSARVVPSHGRFIDILPPRGGKAAALRYLADRAGLAMTETIAAGDSGNDRDMLEAAGRALVPANALPELRLSGAHVIRSPYAHAWGVLDGLATALAPAAV